MQSIKNTSVAVMLLFLSYGVYQVIMKPLPSQQNKEEVEALAISDPIGEFEIESSFESNKSALNPERTNIGSTTIPPKLLELPYGISGNGQDNSDMNPPKSISKPEFGSASGDFSPPLQTGKDFKPNYPSQIASFQTDLGNSDTSIHANSMPQQQDSLNTRNSNQLATDVGLASQLGSDSLINPTTGMSDVAPRPGSRDVMTRSDSQTSTEAEHVEAPLTVAWSKIDSLVQGGEYQKALIELSQFYRGENTHPEDRQQMLDWLDALAAKVIYSSEHHLRSIPYIIQPGDTMASLARQWQVPAQLIYNVNSRKIADPNNLTAGIEIKLIQGPFDAEIDSEQKVMTLFLDNMYAGRFDIQSSQDVSQGEFMIVDKSAQDHIDRPYWISLNNGSSIYASEGVPTENGEIGLRLGEAEEVFSILSASSKIRVLR